MKLHKNKHLNDFIGGLIEDLRELRIAIYSRNKENEEAIKHINEIKKTLLEFGIEYCTEEIDDDEFHECTVSGIKFNKNGNVVND